MTYQLVLTALADQTRRQIFESLLSQERTVGELANAHGVSGPAVSQHLKVLKTAKLVSVTPRGTRNLYAMRREGLRALQTYLDGFWDDALNAYGAEIARRLQEGK